MSTAILSPASTGPPDVATGVVLRDVSWDDYLAQLRIIGERPIRVTYDRGRMEVWMPSRGHERSAYLLGRMIDVITEQLLIGMEAGRNTTHRREDLDRGVEPDGCY